MPSLSARLTIRTSLLAVLAMFMVMLVIGALMGVLSLRENNSSLAGIRATTDADAALAGALMSFQESRLLAERSWRLGQPDAASLAEARRELAQARTQMQRFGTLAQALDDSTAAQRVLTRFDAAVGALDSVLGATRAAEATSRFQAANAASRGYLQEGATFQAQGATMVQERHDTSVTRYRWVLAGVALGAVMAVALVLATYAFLRSVVLRPLAEAGQLFDQMAAGDLTAPVRVDSRNEIGLLMAALQRMQQGLGRAVLAVREGVGQIHQSAEGIAAGNAELSVRTERQAASLQDTAASMEELSATVRQNADNARQADELAASAAQVARQGGVAVGAVVSTMQDIASSATRITDIVSVIDSIAFQTNLLALNAAVEAARAGEQGKGFAVVAREVHGLAQRSAQAAREIRDLVGASQRNVVIGTEQVAHAGATMDEIVAAVQHVNDIMGEITVASREQASGIEQANVALVHMDDATQQNAAMVEQAAAAARALGEEGRVLRDAVAVFRLPEEVSGRTGAGSVVARRATPRARQPLARA